MDALDYKNFNFPKDFFRFYDDGEEIDEVGEYEVEIPFTYSALITLEKIEDSNRFATPYETNANIPANTPPAGPPPFGLPSKNDQKMKILGKYDSSKGKKIATNSLKPCLYKYTYIWQRNGFNYWAFLTSINCCSVSGWRWIGFRWVYFGVDIKRIDSFICY